MHIDKNIMGNKNVLFVFLLLIAVESAAQWNWYNPQSGPFVQNQGWNEDGGNYRRLPLRAKGKVRDDVWSLACESAGLAVRFKTDAEDIKVRYKVSGGYSMPHMPATGVSGVDLYRNADQGFCFGNYSFGDTISYDYHVDCGPEMAKEQEYTLYLPLYNGVDYLEIGVPDSNIFSFIPAASHKPIVLYGTSIAQGACASRPGMAWGNIVGRLSGLPLVNLGFSGNGKLEKEVIDFINEQDAAVYIVDCVPNLTDRGEAEIKELVKRAVEQIREKHDAPILLVEQAGYSNGVTNQGKYEAYTHANAAQAQAYEELKREGVKNLFYLSKDELDFHPDSWVDYVHPSDLGMARQAAAVEKKLRKIIK